MTSVKDGSLTASVVGMKNKNKASVTIPATVTIGDSIYKVTAIGESAFRSNKKIKKVTIGAHINTIGKNSFYGCSKLKTITVKTKLLNKVNANAFKGINKKAVIKVPSDKKKSYKKLFKNKGQAKSVTIK